MCRYKAVGDLKEAFSTAGVDWKQPVITSCGSGVTACILYLGLQLVDPSLQARAFCLVYSMSSCHPSSKTLVLRRHTSNAYLVEDFKASLRVCRTGVVVDPHRNSGSCFQTNLIPDNIGESWAGQGYFPNHATVKIV